MKLWSPAQTRRAVAPSAASAQAPYSDTLVIVDSQATLTGSGMANGAPVTFKVVVKDGSPDTFSVELSNGYSASGNATKGRGITIKIC